MKFRYEENIRNRTRNYTLVITDEELESIKLTDEDYSYMETFDSINNPTISERLDAINFLVRKIENEANNHS